MGYTRYYKVKAGKDAFDKDFLKEVSQAFKFAKEDYGVKIAGWDGTGEPLLEDKVVVFNGLGDESYETFRIDLDDEDEFNFCKTQYMPYDLVVNVVLQLAKEWGYVYDVSNNGETKSDATATKLVEKIRNTF